MWTVSSLLISRGTTFRRNSGYIYLLYKFGESFIIYLHVDAENMERRTCNVDHRPNTDALLPPRKRLLAGFKRQNSDVGSPSLSKNDTPFNIPCMAHINDPTLSIEEIVEASRIAVIESAKVAEAAKAKAEEKAAKAAKAFAAAKSALDLVATLADEAAKKETCLKKNKLKHMCVEESYCTDEELALDLHRSINSSPRIWKNSDVKICKKKKLNLKSSGKIANEEGNPVKKIDEATIDLKTSSKSEQSYQLKMDSSDGKKRRKIKQKRLPLSICSFRDESSLEEDDCKYKGKLLLGVSNGALFSSGSNMKRVERASMWKCQSMKAPDCLKQHKVTRS